ncbi:hypothetical protein PCANC_23959 [Puccinia coronata f. sp. avenae]|uniref:Uncharacterized protein n=1 Tax=Puccinia coronata f. sp. avenae TaxID=200324 RepID=A0A2N5S7C7_9BASI|nr:hypothetical protein PCANC_23959 [Puccinia coronata f. sp. avenae]
MKRTDTRGEMEGVDDGVLYMDVMSWLLSTSEGGEERLDERMLDTLCQLIIYLRLALLDHLMLTIIHSPKLWSPRVRGGNTATSKEDGLDSKEDVAPDRTVEPFLSVFIKLRSACSTKLHRSSLPSPAYSPLPGSGHHTHQTLTRLKPSAIAFINRWRDVVVGVDAKNQTVAQHHTHMDLRQLCLMTILLDSIKPFHLPSRLRNSIEQDCVHLIKHAILATQSATATLPHIPHFHPDSVLSWLAVKAIPSITPINLANSSTNVMIPHLAASLFRVFVEGRLFDGLSTSLDVSGDSLALLAQSRTDEKLKRVLSDPMAQVVLSISLSISQLVENTTSQNFDPSALSADLNNFALMAERIHESWRSATRSHDDQFHLPMFKENSTSITHLNSHDEDPLDRWLRNIFFSCLLILGGLANKLATQEALSDVTADTILPPAFQTLSHIHFITLRFPPDKRSTHSDVYNALVTLAKPHPDLPNRILHECQPPLMTQITSDPVGISRVIYYLNLVESLAGSCIHQDYLDKVVVPFIWTSIRRSKLAFHAHLALPTILPFCSKETVLNLAGPYFDLLIQDVTLEQAPILSFEQQTSSWKNLLKAVSIYSRDKTEALTGELIERIKELDGPEKRQPRLTENHAKKEAEEEGGGLRSQAIEKRKKLYTLLISRIGELDYEESVQETLRFLDTCWELIRCEEDVVELFHVGLNQQALKLTGHGLANIGVKWWLQKTGRLKKLSSKL